MVVFKHRNTRTCEFIDMAKPSDRNIIRVHRKRSKYKDLEGPLLYDVFEKEGPKTDLGGSLLETKDRKTIINITTLSVSI